MSLFTEIEGVVADAEGAVKDKLKALVGGDGEAILAAAVKDALDTAKAAALAEVQSAAPAAAPEVSKALDALESAILSVVAKHLVP